MPSRPQSVELCALGARRVGEPLIGTASRVDVWLVLEVPGAWPIEVEAALPAPAARALGPVLQAVPRSRVLFVKGAPRRKPGSLRFWLAVTDDLEPRLYRFELERYEDLARIDLFEVLAEEERWEVHREREPLYLVCTHGNHDRCCAKFGFAAYQGLARLEPDRVWQSSHVGGDRFAANVVCLPEGTYYGHVDPGESDALQRSTREGRIYPARWRGRSCYGPAVQAAEQSLREATAEWSLSAFYLRARRQVGEVTETVFEELSTGARHTLRVEGAVLEGLRALTCGTPEPKPVRGYRLVDHQVRPSAGRRAGAEGTDFYLEPAAMRDYGFIYRLRRETLHPYLDAMGMPGEEQSRFCAAFDAARHQVIWWREHRLGAVSVIERAEAFHLANLHLLPGYQRSGLGTRLVRELQDRAAAQGVPVTTQVLKVNPARAFYERLGFRVVGEQGPRYRMAWEP